VFTASQMVSRTWGLTLKNLKLSAWEPPSGGGGGRVALSPPPLSLQWSCTRFSAISDESSRVFGSFCSCDVLYLGFRAVYVLGFILVGRFAHMN